MDEKLTKPYDPQATEDRIYQLWEESGFFNPDVCVQKGVCDKDAETFSIVLPPPNVTGTLHMGHSEMLAIQDILVRYNRMRGKKTLWLPGTDHAAIATQTKVEKKMYDEEGTTRHDVGREEFLKRVNQFAKESHDTIVHQIKKMGSSVDWSREAFTLDEKRTIAVRTAFKKMYDDGLVYRGHRIVNWCPHCYSTLSDDEVEYKEKKAVLYTFKYAKDFPFAIATTRPETKLGDSAVAVNPNDERYKAHIGEIFTVDLGHGAQTIKVIADEAVDPEYGTGALGVTPAHSMTDYDMAQKNDLPLIKVIDEHGKMTKEAGAQYEGLKVKEARAKFVQWLKDEELLLKEEEVDQNLSICYRCARPVEPLPSLQWFVNVNKTFTIPHSNIKGVTAGQQITLKELMHIVVQNGQIQIVPERFAKIYFHWIENLRDWCISRQIWYGHQIPVWYRDEETYVGVEKPKDAGWTQDPDTLDTWFSSGLWTFSTLGWPEETADLRTYHPTAILETGYDILFFWVARMVLMTTYLLGDIPFKNVYLHGLVRDERGRKMSKSIGNVIDPLDMIKIYGTDATRMSLIIGTSPGNDMKLSEEKIKAYKHFANKIWNITRFVVSNTEDTDLTVKPELTDHDRENLKELDALVADITKEIEQYHFYLAGEKLYHYVWHRFADVVIEESKVRLYGDNAVERSSAQWTLFHILTTSVTLLHPFMPFITEEVWSMLAHDKKNLLMIEPWPRS
ncbi:MAG: valine--tRNA ligase [Patescibacteria group bacterium]|nr:valine--tRNA ligase [Patescibacteria group bacterium]